MKNRFGYSGRMKFYQHRFMFVQRCHLVNIHIPERELYVLQEIISLGYLFYIMDTNEPGNGHVGICLLVFLVMLYQVRNAQQLVPFAIGEHIDGQQQYADDFSQRG